MWVLGIQDQSQAQHGGRRLPPLPRPSGWLFASWKMVALGESLMPSVKAPTFLLVVGFSYQFY